MVCFQFEPEMAGWKVQMNQLSYGDTLIRDLPRLTSLEHSSSPQSN